MALRFLVGAACLAWSSMAAAETLVAPVPQTSTLVPPPADAPPLAAILEVRANLVIDETGAVTRVDLAGGPYGPWGEAVLVAATHFVFSPALSDGHPVVAGITFTQQFAPLPPVAPPKAPQGTLEVLVVEKGTGLPVSGAEVHALVDGLDVASTSDIQGLGALTLNAGITRVRVKRAGYKEFTVQEEIHINETLRVRYLLERSSYLDYETVVIGKADRNEVSRTSLGGAEITQVPGTFGDPFRVITALPGVSTLFSLLGYAIIRGTSPGSTAYMLDQVTVPELFHLLAGPSVIHPEFVDHVDFYPGTFPAEYGGYVGGIVDGITRRVAPDEKKIEVDLDLLQSGAFLRGPLPFGFTGTAAGRYGYPGLLLDAFQAPIGLTYWDYQGRLDGAVGGGHLKIFVFGAFDELTNVNNGVSQIDYGTQFHRIDAVWQRERDNLYQAYSVILGFDETLAGTIASDLQSFSANPRARWRLKVLDNLTIRGGLDIGITTFGGQAAQSADNSGSSMQNFDAFIDAPWWPHPDFQLVLGARVDQYYNGTTTQVGPDWRIGMRWRVANTDGGDVWLKAGGGHFSQPPRLILPLPGYEQLALQQGLSSSYQAMVGAEIPLGLLADIDVQAYFNYMDRIIFDLSINYDPDEPPQITYGTATSLPIFLGSLLAPDSGRTYGVEVILRHRNQGNFFGWLSGTLSRSERYRDSTWAPFDFDRTLILQAVAGWRLPRDWQVGGRVQFETGRPVSSDTAYNVDRSPPFYRADIRVDKRVVYEHWLLDFYVDIINVTVASEYITETSQSFNYILPTLGVRGEF